MTKDDFVVLAENEGFMYLLFNYGFDVSDIPKDAPLDVVKALTHLIEARSAHDRVCSYLYDA
jgi:hypothetical protein